MIIFVYGRRRLIIPLSHISLGRLSPCDEATADHVEHVVSPFNRLFHENLRFPNLNQQNCQRNIFVCPSNHEEATVQSVTGNLFLCHPVSHFSQTTMGIPKMFRFLTDRYPLIMQRLHEDHVFDHFYLDMNGIIHQCTHPSDTEIPVEDIDDMFSRIFNYTERLYRIVAPTTLMFLAIDGVAPRAKMNQQRSRRFRSAKAAERTMAEAVARGDEIPSGTPFDSNCITPGTEFMYELSQQFRSWIHHKMSTDPAWQQGCTVVFSGSEVPGEGEHKIMDYIRSWQKSKQYDPSVRHCMYGLDADLMMLGLVAHAPHFTLLREKFRFSRNGRKVPQMKGTEKDADEFELLEIAMLRDMLFLEFERGESDGVLLRGRRKPGGLHGRLERKALNAPFSSDESDPSSANESSLLESGKKPGFRYDARRIVDDFVFMCILVGNDFVPNLPHLDIAEGAINLMFRIYKHMLPGWGGYLTDRHRLHPNRLESFLQKIAQSESHYFDHRAESDGVNEYRTPEYRKKYYELKFNFDVESDDGLQRLKQLRQIYMEGLHWVLQYYHNGVSSWNWFYPDFYAVLARDMVGLRRVKVSFKKGYPFKPLTQLMAVLPPESAHFLPDPMRELMVNPSSPVVDFYPVEFVTDPNGKKNDWEAVVVVPFIDEERLLQEINTIDKDNELSGAERKRDELGPEYWFHAKDYPRSDLEILPVRPSKYYIPHSRRSRTPSPTSRSSSPRSFRKSEAAHGFEVSGTEQNASPTARPRRKPGGNPGTSVRHTKTGTSARLRDGGTRGRGRGRNVVRRKKDVVPPADSPES